jgi:autoinducer 2-degrading protein
MFSIFVRINVQADRCSEFAEASLADAQGSVRDEPGCVRFDIHRDASRPNRFYLYEVYRDREAFETHLSSPHFKKWFSTVEDMIDGEFERVEMEPVFPSRQGWDRQKAGLLRW